ncbi:hypothetical protein [Streptomyces sp. NBC_00564]|uniref:hypothetical protein n=1 Tax=Streptomyces sp. NBC_00564 TaxID=2903663 RepID=UPI00352F11CB|nr:hypothetical protein OG256_13170 [Streptomyces sp. NBC_00564]
MTHEVLAYELSVIGRTSSNKVELSSTRHRAGDIAHLRVVHILHPLSHQPGIRQILGEDLIQDPAQRHPVPADIHPHLIGQALDLLRRHLLALPNYHVDLLDQLRWGPLRSK